MKKGEKCDNTIRSNMLRGNIDLMFLELLSEKDVFAFQAIIELERLGIFLKNGSVHSPFYRMVKSGYISEYKVDEKVYYHIEPRGLKYLKKLKAEYERIHFAHEILWRKKKNE